MKVGILGLGLIGGSMARAYAKAGHTVLACETNRSMLSFSQLAGIVSGPLDQSNIGQCQLIILAVYPGDSIKWLQENAELIANDAFVIDCCGTKREICSQGFPLAQKYGFTFVGGHPMAGSHFSGFKFSRSNLFQGAPMVLVPPCYDRPELLEQLKKLLIPCHFGTFSITTPEEHDRLIAFTSQMPHIISNAFIKSPTAADHTGFSAGSYKDLTRVARLSAQMWAELCIENRDHVIFELNTYIENLSEYRDALEQNNLKKLTELFEAGKQRKEALDG